MILLLAIIMGVVLVLGFILLLVFGPLLDWVPDVIYTLMRKRRNDSEPAAPPNRPPPLGEKFSDD